MWQGSANSRLLPATVPSPIALEDIWVKGIPGLTRNRTFILCLGSNLGWKRKKTYILKCWQGVRERVGFHTCTQLEDLTLALLPPGPSTQKPLLSTVTRSLASSHGVGCLTPDETAHTAELMWETRGKVPWKPRYAVSKAQYLVLSLQDTGLLFCCAHRSAHNHRARPWSPPSLVPP